MSALPLLALAFAIIIAVGSVAVLVNDVVEGWLRRIDARPSTGGGFDPAPEHAHMPGARSNGAGTARPPTPGVRTGTYGRVVERRSAAGRLRRRPAEAR